MEKVSKTELFFNKIQKQLINNRKTTKEKCDFLLFRQGEVHKKEHGTP